jgi:hypothetical protein
MRISSVLTAVELSLLRSSAHSQLWCSLGLRVARSLAFTLALLSPHCTKIQGSPWDRSVLIETERNSFYIVLGKEKVWIDCGWLAGVGRMSLDIKWQFFFHGVQTSPTTFYSGMLHTTVRNMKEVKPLPEVHCFLSKRAQVPTPSTCGTCQVQCQVSNFEGKSRGYLGMNGYPYPLGQSSKYILQI